MTEQSRQYKKIRRLKPIIEGTPELVARLKACFDYSVNQRRSRDGIPPIPELVTDEDNSSRFIFNGFEPVNDPEAEEQDYFVLKTSINHQNCNYKFQEGRRKGLSPSSLTRLYSEIGRLEDNNYSLDFQDDKPSILAAVLDWRHNEAGLLMEDYTKGGEYTIKSYEYGERIKIFDGDTKIRFAWSDMKRGQGGYFEGIKYLNKIARIELR